jgi:LmbE family N-acetylglucosaminyl deacetylase
MRLTAIMAHPDDAEIWAGGTIRKHVARGRGIFDFEESLGPGSCATGWYNCHAQIA